MLKVFWNWQKPADHTGGKLSLKIIILPLLHLLELGLIPAVGLAQIIPDNTLGTETSTITTPEPQTIRIEGGAIRGANLFHSFGEFNIGAGSSVYFTNPDAIQNIINRVTGGNPSQINGTLGVLGNANLFLLNPNGIIFGPNASLDIRGSFLVTTASSLLFENGIEYSANNPQAPPLLTINVPTGLQYGNNPGSIQLQNTNLQLPANQTLALIGGNTTIDGAKLQVPGGNIYLGCGSNCSLSPHGISFTLTGDEIGNNPPIPRDITITNAAEINVRGSDTGNIAITASNLDISGSSQLLAGIDTGLGNPTSQAGNITLNATGNINISDNSLIANQVLEESLGNGGNINIDTTSLFVTSGAELLTGTFSSGNGGHINIIATDSILFDSGKVKASVEILAPGNGGNININTGNLTVRNDAVLSNTKFGLGNGGDINIDVGDTINIDNRGYIGSDLRGGSRGNSGSVNIHTRSLFATNGGEISASLVFGDGAAGSVNINASGEIVFDNGSAYSRVELGSFGATSGINITANALTLTNGAQLDASTLWVGNAGDINLDVGSLVITRVSAINAETFGAGNGGNINITARDSILIDGGNTSFLTGIFSSVGRDGEGQGGDVNITTGSLTLLNGAYIQVENRGIGNAGNIIINARDSVVLDGVREEFSLPTEIQADVEDGAEGSAGNIEITTGSLSVTNGAQINTGTNGTGNGGDILIKAKDNVILDGVGPANLGGIFANVGDTGVGVGGNIEIETGALIVRNGGTITTSTFGQGDGGQLIITARDKVVVDGVSNQEFIDFSEEDEELDSAQFFSQEASFMRFSSSVASRVSEDAVGNGGDIEITTGSLVVSNGGELIASTQGDGNAGNINIAAKDRVIFDGVGSHQSASAAVTTVGIFASGDGGNINIAAESFSLTNQAFLSASSFGVGTAGNIQIAANSIFLADQAFLSANTIGGQGNISLNGGDIILRRGSGITTDASGDATGGNITINTTNLVALENSDISANAEDSFGGRVVVNARGIFGTQFRNETTAFSDITASSQLGAEFSGSVEINTPEVDPSSGLVNLPANFIDAASLMGRDPCNKGKESEFTITGRGGLPPTPFEAMTSGASVVEWARERESERPIGENPVSINQGQVMVNPRIVEATGWTLAADGTVVLTADLIGTNGMGIFANGCAALGE
ncbi:MAG TPA: filamentous hemagglutinin N-terminal domain-containing protein [Oscillatoriaceae cyanobacterium M33_DOE_052]|uniref:Filamentous hemagglutinin N-terminal domain-containing protein n=1 Tax=Planktothricoides sp. SpSt-374 TaxID=2282167 RepID=A0A7C3VPE3_9CYAN|nr:filamentous hemagglutinin N-terminal domain-containing protein [Oscillatoriaceae cyanobacterium M33_DOE_052]